MTKAPLTPEDRAYLREVMNSGAGRKWMQVIIALRPPIGGTTGEERALRASEAMGYERAVHNMAQLLEDIPQSPEIKSVDIRTD
jgi:hypothetical protein